VSVAGRSSGTKRASFAVGLGAGALAGLIAVDLGLTGAFSIWADSSVVPVLSAAAFAVAWLTPLRRACAAATAAAAVLWLAISFTPLTRLLADGLVRRDPLESADAVFVFASRVQKDGEPTSDAMSRLLKGLQLVGERRASRLIVSEIPKLRPYAAIAREWAHDFAPDTEILAVGPITNTREEAVAVARLCRARGWRRVLAVTSPLHTRRASSALEREGLEVVAVPAVETRYDLETLDWPGDRRRGFGAALHERLGLFVYGRRGWLDASR
jgi:uncharacterized SAM-binding protein YcdF (DUF218 family)